MSDNRIVPITFVSIWDNELQIATKGFFDTEEHRIFDVCVADVEGVETLEQEYIELEDGTVLEVCQECHNHVLVEKEDEKGEHQLVCPSCDSKEEKE